MGEAAARHCMNKEVGLTEACTTCWSAQLIRRLTSMIFPCRVDNIFCDSVTCMWICLKAKIEHWPPTKPDGSLNDCLACDENYCGSVA